MSIFSYQTLWAVTLLPKVLYSLNRNFLRGTVSAVGIGDCQESPLPASSIYDAGGNYSYTEALAIRNKILT